MEKVIIIGAGPGGIFAAYELTKRAPGLKIGVFEAGNPLEKRKCPIDGKKVKSWPKAYRPFVLKAAKGTTITGGQHAAYLLDDHDGNANTRDLLLYDNNYAVTNGNKKTSGKFSQAVQYTVNEKHMTIKQNWAYGKSLGKANYTDRIGNSQRLANGNHLIDFGYLNAKNGTGSNIIEVAGDQQVFNLHVDNIPDKGYVYRAYRQPLFPSNYTFDLN